MLKRTFIVAGFAALLALAGCATTPDKPEAQPDPQPDQVMQALRASAVDIQSSWNRLARIRQGDAPPPVALPEPAPNSELARTVTIRWEGPLRELVEYLGDRIGYEVKTLGRTPVTPVMISIDADGWRIYDVIASAALQGGTQAGVVIKPSLRQLVIVYPESGDY